jgi:hypothetical protein
MKQLNLKFRDWMLIAVVLGTMWLCCAACTTERYAVPALLQPTPLEELQQQAELPAYLVPPPAQATPRQREKWTNAQTKALANVGAPAAGKVKLKNVGNTDDHSEATVHQGMTGRQLTTSVVLLGIVGLVCWLKPWRT